MGILFALLYEELQPIGEMRESSHIKWNFIVASLRMQC